MATRRQATLAVLGLLVMVGCQPQAQVPLPTFNGPTIVQRPSPGPQQSPAPGKPAPSGSHGRLALPAGPREWAPVVAPRPWRYIVLHHSATPTGGAVMFDRIHRDKGWDEMGYHFVVGNGTETGNGAIEVGSRWPKQKWGAHTKTPDNRFNDFGIGICLVGNFDVGNPTSQQMRSVSKLVAYLMQAYRIPPERVLGHGDCKPTDCPGRHMRVAEVRRMARQILAESGVKIEADDSRLAQGELLTRTQAH